jgi:hypothetical protein
MARAHRRVCAVRIGIAASTLVACGPRYIANGQPEPPPAVEPEELPASTPASVATPAADPWAGCRVDAECGLPEDPRSFAVCEAGACQRWDAAQMWTWATTTAPELATLREASSLAEVPWIPATGTLRLFVDARQLIWSNKARCIPIDLEPLEGALVGEIPQVFGTKPGTKNAWFYTLRLGGGVDVLGPGRRTTGAAGDGAEAIGDLQTLGLHLRATEDALRYTAARFTAEVVCGSAKIERQGCEPAVCDGCTELAVRKRPVDSNHAIGSGSVSRGSHGGACEPCPPDALGPLLPRLDAAVAGRTFVDDRGDDAGPIFHRTLQQCNAAVKQRSRRMARARRPL